MSFQFWDRSHPYFDVDWNQSQTRTLNLKRFSLTYPWELCNYMTKREKKGTRFRNECWLKYLEQLHNFLLWIMTKSNIFLTDMNHIPFHQCLISLTTYLPLKFAWGSPCLFSYFYVGCYCWLCQMTAHRGKKKSLDLVSFFQPRQQHHFCHKSCGNLRLGEEAFPSVLTAGPYWEDLTVFMILMFTRLDLKLFEVPEPYWSS